MSFKFAQLSHDALRDVKSGLEVTQGHGNSTDEYGGYNFPLEFYSNFVSVFYGL